MKRILFLIFILAFLIRLLYFPENVYFGYDSARDSFAALDILKGDIKIVGPPTSLNGNFFHGTLYYYLIAPVYFFFNHNPEAVSIFLRISNALGVVLVFMIGRALFSGYVGLLAAFLFAVSYEQTQYSLMFGHPSLSVISVLIFYLGLSLLIFKNKNCGLGIALLGLGLSIQFEAVYALQFLVLVAMLFIFSKKFNPLSFKTFFWSVVLFLASISTFILAEVKFNFRSTKAILQTITTILSVNSGGSHLLNYFSVAERLIHDNFIAENTAALILSTVFLIAALVLSRNSQLRPKIIFMSVWFFGGMLPNLIGNNFSYYYSAGAAVSLAIFMAFLLNKFYKRAKIAVVSILVLIVLSNFSLIKSQNITGPNPDIIIQPGMLVSDEKRVLDYIYQNSESQNFSVNAITVPFNINTTWSYLFQWYGQGKYDYLPVWGGETALGFPGNLLVETNRAKLPKTRFTIIEPTNGIPDFQIQQFFQQENFFSKVVEEKKFGTIVIQRRIQI